METRYFIFDKHGTRKPGAFPYGTLITAIQLAIGIGGVVYHSNGRLLWQDPDVSYSFRRPHTVSLEGVSGGFYCICDQCQGEWGN